MHVVSLEVREEFVQVGLSGVEGWDSWWKVCTRVVDVDGASVEVPERNRQSLKGITGLWDPNTC